jgi:hypothetical protein
MKWFAVATMQTKIKVGYAIPSTFIKTVNNLSLKFNRLYGCPCDRSKEKMVRPMRRLYPKCRLGIAANWLQNLFDVHTLLSPFAPWTVSTNPYDLASFALAP